MISHKHSQPNFKFGSWCFEKNIYNVLSYSRKNGKKKYNRITISNKKKYIFSFQATVKYWLISPIARALLQNWRKKKNKK